MQVLDCEQLDGNWFQAHVGRVTGSHAADVLNFLKSGKEGADRRNYRAQKVAEILTGKYYSDTFVTKEMEWGIDTEPAARRAYALEEGVFVEQLGFVIGDNGRTGCSPDGLVDEKGIVGFKCPKTATHIKWMLEGVFPEEHLPQAVFELMILKDREWFDFVSYDPRLPKRYRMFTIRLERKEAGIEGLESAVNQFLSEVDETIERLNEIAPPVEDDEEEISLEDNGTGITEDDLDWARKNLPGFKEA